MRTIVHNSKPKKVSPRQKLGAITSNGELRYWLHDKMDDETLNLLVDVVMRYCEPRPLRRSR